MFKLCVGWTIRARGSAARSSLLLRIPSGYAECSLGDVFAAHRHLHQEHRRKVSLFFSLFPTLPETVAPAHFNRNTNVSIFKFSLLQRGIILSKILF